MHQTPSTPPIEVAFPDLTRWAAGNAGIPYVWTFAGPAAGPHVLVQALTHGNEVCGAIALDWLLAADFRPTRGALSLCFANIAAYEGFDRADPARARPPISPARARCARSTSASTTSSICIR